MAKRSHYLITAILALIAMSWIRNLFSNPAEYDKAQEIKKQIDALFTYQSDWEKFGVNNKMEFWDGSKPIKADCEEYAMGAGLQMRNAGYPYEMKVVRTNDNQPHMIACGPLYCMDNLNQQPYTLAQAHKLFTFK